MKLHDLKAFSDLSQEKNKYRDINTLANSIIKIIISIDSWSNIVSEEDNFYFLNTMFTSPISLNVLSQSNVFNRSNFGINSKVKNEFILALEENLNNKVYYENKTLEALLVNLAEKGNVICAQLVMSKIEESRCQSILEKTQK